MPGGDQALEVYQPDRPRRHTRNIGGPVGSDAGLVSAKGLVLAPAEPEHLRRTAATSTSVLERGHESLHQGVGTAPNSGTPSSGSRPGRSPWGCHTSYSCSPLAGRGKPRGRAKGRAAASDSGDRGAPCATTVSYTQQSTRLP